MSVANIEWEKVHDPNQSFAIKKILASQIKNGIKRYRIKWVDSDELSWETEENLIKDGLELGEQVFYIYIKIIFSCLVLYILFFGC